MLHVPEAGKSKLLLPSADLASTSNIPPPVTSPAYENGTGQRLEVKLMIVLHSVALLLIFIVAGLPYLGCSILHLRLNELYSLLHDLNLDSSMYIVQIVGSGKEVGQIRMHHLLNPAFLLWIFVQKSSRQNPKRNPGCFS